jgi:hypothetical protein
VRENNIPFEDRGPLQLLMGEDFFILLHEVNGSHCVFVFDFFMFIFSLYDAHGEA